jgi:hypothetical protein
MRSAVGLAILLLLASSAAPRGLEWEDVRLISPHFAGRSIEPRRTVQDDVVLAGREVEVSGTVYGDVLAVAGSARFPGTVVGDINVLARSVEIDGTAYDDARLICSEATVGTFIASNLDAWCRSVRLAPGSEIGGSAGFLAVDCELLGTIVGNVRGVARRVTIGGYVDGDVDLLFSESLTLLPGTSIGGNLHYLSYEPALIPEDVTVGGSIEHTILPRTPHRVLELARRWIIPAALLTLFVVGLVFVSIAPRFSIQAAQTLSVSPVKSVVSSILIFLGTPFLLLGLAVSLIGLPLALVGAALYFTALLVAPSLFAVIVGRALLRRRHIGPEPSPYVALILGFVPVALSLGFEYTRLIACGIAVLFGLGAAALTAWDRYRQLRRSGLI